MTYVKLTIFASLVCLTAAPALADDHYSIGLEGFYDNYREPETGVDVNSHAYYGSVTGNYTHGLGADYFIGLDGRLSYGEDDYKSVSGTDNNIPQYEGEFRVLGGRDLSLGEGGTVSPYLGLGTRLYYDNSNGTITNLGYSGYDREIEQYYIPLGINYKYQLGAYQLAPNIEYDQLVFGQVHSKTQGITGYNLTNEQHDGYGLRGAFMVGQEQNGYGWQFGPFVRYWNINQSNVDVHGNTGWIEPHNNRVQAGMGLKFDY